MPLAMGDGGQGEDWKNERLETTYEEARAVLDSQQDNLSDIDTKSMQTVRTTLVVIGIIVSAERLGEVEILAGTLGAAGLSCLAFCIVLGIINYSESAAFTGPQQKYINDLVDGDVENDRWDEDLIKSFGVWINHNSTIVWTNGLILKIAHAFLIAGVIFLLYSIRF